VRSNPVLKRLDDSFGRAADGCNGDYMKDVKSWIRTSCRRLPGTPMVGLEPMTCHHQPYFVCFGPWL